MCEPATFYVRVNKREKRGSHCQEEQGVATAPAPAKIVPKSKLSNEFIIEALAQKYPATPASLSAMRRLADNYDFELSRKTVTDGMLAAGELLRAVVRAQAAELLALPICKPMKHRAGADRGKNRAQPSGLLASKTHGCW